MARFLCAFAMALFLAYQARADQITEPSRLDAPVTIFECEHFGQTVRMPDGYPYEVYRVAHCTGGILVLAPDRETKRLREEPETEI